MLKLNGKKKLKILTFSILSLLITFIIGLGVSQMFLKKIKTNTVTNLENQWRDEARDKTNYLAQQLELSIAKNELNYWNDNELHSWIIEHMLPMKVSGELSNIVVVNIGYSLRKWDDTNWNSIKQSYGIEISSELDNQIKNYFDKIKIENSSNIHIDDMVIKFVGGLEISSIEKEDLISSIRQVLFIKNKVLLDTDPNSIINNKFTNYKSLSEYLEKDIENFKDNFDRITSGTDSKYHEMSTLITSKSKKFIEWSVVPPNKLGWELEPPHITGVDNVAYKKIAIIVEMDRDEIYSSYDKDLSKINTFIFATNILMLIIVIVVLSALMVNFYRFLSNDR